MMTHLKRAKVWFAILAMTILALPVSAPAATIYLQSGGSDLSIGTTDLNIGQTYQLELWTVDFGALVGSVGGGVDVFYNSTVFDYVSWTDTSGSLIGANGLPQDLLGEVNAIQVDLGSFDFLPVEAMQSGVIEFTVLPTAALGLTSMTMAENDTPLGGFYASESINFTGGNFNITDVVPVPLPGGLLLMSSALGLAGLARRSRGK